MADVNVACRSCGKRVLMDVMRYDPENRKNLICPECFNHKVQKKDESSRTRKLLISLQKPKDEGGFVKHKCYDCGYEFMRKAVSRQKNCPYCGKRTAHVQQKPGLDWAKEL